MPTTADRLLDEIVDTIIREVDAEQVYVFGSYARGDAHPDSDIDVLIVEKDPIDGSESRLPRMGRLYRALAARKLGRSFDVLLYSTEEFDRWSDSRNHVIGRCRREGKLIYARH